MKKQIVLFIDGENFLHKVNDVIRQSKIKLSNADVLHIGLKQLLNNAFDDIDIDQKFFYAARLHEHKETKEKSRELIKSQRILKTHLEKEGFNFIIAGNVRAQIISAGQKSTIIFKEKGVDVRIAVDLVSMACDGLIDTAILCSSDSDLQPAVSEIKKRGVNVVYLGFEMNPNKGLMYTADKTILLRDSEIIDAVRTIKTGKK